MIGGKRKPGQLALIKKIGGEFPKDFNWYALLSVLDQIIDRMETNFMNNG